MRGFVVVVRDPAVDAVLAQIGGALRLRPGLALLDLRILGKREFDHYLQVLSDDELQPGPDFIHGGDLDVDEVELQRLGANDTLGDVGRHFRCLLRPGDPDHAVALDSRLDIDQAILDLGALPGEGMDGIVFLANARNLRPVRQPVDLSEVDGVGEIVEVVGQRDEGGGHAVLQAELGRKGRAGISRGRQRHRQYTLAFGAILAGLMPPSASLSSSSVCTGR